MAQRRGRRLWLARSTSSGKKRGGRSSSGKKRHSRSSSGKKSG
jgi:hypothetical protein